MPNRISPVEANAEKISFFLDSILWLTFTLFRRTLISVLLVDVFVLLLPKYFSNNFSLTLKDELFIIQLNHEFESFANFIKTKGKFLEWLIQKLKLKE